MQTTSTVAMSGTRRFIDSPPQENSEEEDDEEEASIKPSSR